MSNSSNSTNIAERSSLLYIIYTFYSNSVLLCAIILLVRFYFISRKKQFQFSTQLKIHVTTWLVCTSSTFIFQFPSIFELTFPAIYTQGMYITFDNIKGCLYFASSQSIPISTTFLLIDRIEVILFIYMSKRRIYTQYLSIVLIATLFVANFSMLYYRAISHPDQSAKCNMACKVGDYVDDLLASKMALSAINVIIGSYFVYLYVRYYKKTTIKHEKKKNYIVLLMFLNEIIFTISPSAVYVIFHNNPLPWISIVPFRLIIVCFCTDGFLTALIYSHVKNKIVPTQNRLVVVSTVNVIRNNDVSAVS